MARKKIVFVIVEGPSDMVALGAILSKLFNNDKVHVEVMHCDITSRSGINPSNIITSISSFVRQYASNNHFQSMHFKYIIHIVDTDGAFCSDNYIVEDHSVNGLIYSETEIKTPNKELTISRNVQKTQNLLKISRTNSIWRIPYNVYYMSCNIEHVLFNLLNCSDDEKENLSYVFAKKYKDNIPGFIEFISNPLIAIDNEYIESWKFIQNENNSLKRYTNFNICLKNNK